MVCVLIQNLKQESSYAVIEGYVVCKLGAPLCRGADWHIWKGRGREPNVSIFVLEMPSLRIINLVLGDTGPPVQKWSMFL